jgi:hypothetical protein
MFAVKSKRTANIDQSVFATGDDNHGREPAASLDIKAEKATPSRAVDAAISIYSGMVGAPWSPGAR